jgi:hypothetical protein
MAIPPPGMGMGMGMPTGFGMPIAPPVSPYPGTFMENMMPQNQYGPRFDGMFAAGLSEVPKLNAEFLDIDRMQQAIYASNGLGYPPMMGSMPGMPPMGMPGMPPPMPMPPNTMPPPAGGHGEAAPTGGHSGGSGGH